MARRSAVKTEVEQEASFLLWKLRRQLCRIWLVFLALSLATVIVGPTVRYFRLGKTDPEFDTRIAINMVIQTSPFWLVPLGCFARYWFPAIGQQAIRTEVLAVPEGGAKLAIWFTIIVNLFVWYYLLQICWIQEFGLFDADGRTVGGSPTELVSAVLGFAQLVNAIFLGILSYVAAPPLPANENAQNIGVK